MTKARLRALRVLLGPLAASVLTSGILLAVTNPAGRAGAVPSLSFTPSPGGTCTTTASTAVAGISIADPACYWNSGTNSYVTTSSGPEMFAPVDGSSVFSGILSDGSAVRVEVPANWNHTLIMFAHGYRGTGTTVWVDDPTLRSFYVAHGYAWAASSYDQNGYDVGSGVTDTHDLMTMFSAITGEPAPAATIMTGLSMGGEITVVEIEAYKGQFVGAMPYCGVIGANKLFDYYLGNNVTAAALTNTSIQYPTTLLSGLAYSATYDQKVLSELPVLGITPTSPYTFATNLTSTGQQWADAVEQLSGGTRPGFGGALAYWNSFGFAPLYNIPFLFGLYPGLNGGTLGFTPNQSVAGNVGTEYTLDNQPGMLSPAEQALNSDVLRVPRTYPFTPFDPANPTQVPDVIGDPGIPVLSLHGIGDLFVPFSMEQSYAEAMISHGQGDLFVSRAIREVGHCDYTQSELQAGFSDLVNWIQTGQRPAGDDILNPEVVASPTFGCRFTDGTHPYFIGVPCPAHDTGPLHGYGPDGRQPPPPA